MRDRESTVQAIRRAVERDDLLRLAAGADRAVAIVRQRDLDNHEFGAGMLFDLALTRQLDVATGSTRWGLRVQAWDHAAVLVRFCEQVGHPLSDCKLSAAEMYQQALAELTENEPPRGLRRLDKDLTLGVLIRVHAARELRLSGRFDEARDLARRSPADLYGTGAEAQIAHYLYEYGTTFIVQDAAEENRHQYAELASYWTQTRARGFSTHYRSELIQALTTWSASPGDGRALKHFQEAIGWLHAANAPDDVDAFGRGGEDSVAVRDVTVLLTYAEYLVAVGDEDAREAANFAARALIAADTIRSRWRVIARSRAPLTEVFRRVYGDIALLSHRMGSDYAAEVGLRVAVSAKSTGFAARIRDGRTLDDNPLVSGLLAEINALENPDPGPMTDVPETRLQQLNSLERALATAVSPMLADTVFPGPADVPSLVKSFGPRYVLDYVELVDSLGQTAMFRSFVEPGGTLTFDRIDPGRGFRAFVDSLEHPGDLALGLRGDAADRRSGPYRDLDLASVPGMHRDGRPDFRVLALQLLPPRLLEVVLPRSEVDLPIRLLICAHAWLSLVPWAALAIDDHGTRLVQRAVIAQCPVLTCLSGELPPRVTGPTLVRLVGRDEGKSQSVEVGRVGVNVAAERTAWNLGLSTDGVPLTGFDVHGETPLAPGVAGSLGEALTGRHRWQFLHIAAHGSGTGFDQRLHIPGEPMSAARALGLRWPASVLMASCHVGLVRNVHGAEPLSLVTALLTGGARCVVAGIDRVDDDGTGRVAAAMVEEIQLHRISLDVALRNAQLVEVKRGEPESSWALLTAYIR